MWRWILGQPARTNRAVFGVAVGCAATRPRDRNDRKNVLRRISEDRSIAFRLVETMSRRMQDLTGELPRVESSSRAGT